ncbi:MAG: bifunctional riboflavin kinase/FMN adenylyltransferase [Phycisphaerales bacterium]
MPDSPDPHKHQTALTTALTIGNFDGVHLGHQLLLQHARSAIAPQGRLIALSFHPHPLTTLNPAVAPPQIESFKVRRQRLLDAGADEVIELAPTPSLLAKDPQSFLNEIIDDYQPTLIVEGHDFHFGRARSGTPTTLTELCDLRGIQTQILGPVKVTLTDQSIVTASSSLTRWLLDYGRVRDAAYVLGRSHELTGTVVQGQQLGRTINIPTINLDTESHLPADGVYSGFAHFNTPSGPQRTLAAINVGSRPTVQGTTRRAEAHLLNTDGSSWIPHPDLPEYGWDCTLQLTGWIRDQVKFDSIDTLKQQIRRDCGRICEVLSC